LDINGNEEWLKLLKVCALRAQRGLLCPIRSGGSESWLVPLKRRLHILEYFV